MRELGGDFEINESQKSVNFMIPVIVKRFIQERLAPPQFLDTESSFKVGPAQISDALKKVLIEKGILELHQFKLTKEILRQPTNALKNQPKERKFSYVPRRLCQAELELKSIKDFMKITKQVTSHQVINQKKKRGSSATKFEQPKLNTWFNRS